MGVLGHYQPFGQYRPSVNDVTLFSGAFVQATAIDSRIDIDGPANVSYDGTPPGFRVPNSQLLVQGAFFGPTMFIRHTGDLTGDFAVDAADASVLFENWGGTPPVAALADINDDGIIDAADSSIVFENWTGDTTHSIPEPASGYLVVLLLAVFPLVKK